MDEIIKLPYEISLWEDRLTLVDKDGQEYDTWADASTVDAIDQYYKEKKLCVIGSNSMNSPIGVVEPNLVRKTDGTSTLTFSMYSKYYDEESGEFKENPFMKYLTNERKVKLKYYPNGELRWLDFVIKNIQESSENYKFTYTATDLFINELSKTGYNLEFDIESENNQGTVQGLAQQILEGSDWQVGEDSEIIQQLNNEALYDIELTDDLEVKDIFTEEDKTIKAKWKAEDGTEQPTHIYAFYSCVNGGDPNYFQFIYNENNKYVIDENNVVHDVGNYYCSKQDVKGLPPTYFNGFRGEKYIRTQKSKYDKILSRPVSIYQNVQNDGKEVSEVYGYVESEYFTPSLVTSYITNGRNILSPAGWDQEESGTVPVEINPPYSKNIAEGEERKFGIKFTQKKDKNRYLLNSGFRDNAEIIKEIVKDDKFVFRIKREGLNDNQCFKIVVGTSPDKSKALFSGKASHKDNEGYWFVKDMKAERSVSYKELTDITLENKLNIYLSIDTALDTKECFIYQVELFPQKEGQVEMNGETKYGIVLPDGRVLYEEQGEYLVSQEIAQSQVKTKYFYYTPNEAFTKPEEIEYLYIGYDKQNYTPVYDQNFEKVRSISKKETNRFDLLQTLSENFECWCRFDIWHKETGEIMLAKDLELLVNSGDASSKEKIVFLGGVSYDFEDIVITANSGLADLGFGPFQQLKFVTFHKRIGQKKNIGFKYGINLKSISRTLDSNDIATKLIVKSNTNEFAEGGSCNIALAEENPSGENFVYDFTYYIKQGLMNGDNLTNDLYYYEDEKTTNPRGWIGLYVKLKALNNIRDNLITQYTSCTGRYAHNKSTLENAKILCNASQDELDDLEDKYYDIVREEFNGNVSDSYKNDSNITGMAYNIERLKKEIAQANIDYENAKNQMKQLNEEIKKLEEELKSIEGQTAQLIEKFEKKYSRFIQEASWVSEDHIDNNLYYIDAETTLHKSAQPKVSYTINIVELNQLEEYKNYFFDLGDITYIQDTDFFGWKQGEKLKTPHKEEIVITETSTFFHSPEKCTIKAQNYRSAFEDLFKRLTATSQQLKFHSGEFERAADVVDANGNIAPSCLEDAFSNNAYVLSNAANESVKWNEFGITTTNLNKPTDIVRITGGGIFLTNDGGEKWTTGITANGINAKTITTGTLNTGLVNIYNGSQKSFVWDSQGLNAYTQKDEGGYDTSKFVRFNQYGIFGADTSGGKNFDSEGNIKENASFYLGWDGITATRGKIADWDIEESQITKVVNIGTEASPIHRRVSLGSNPKFPAFFVTPSDALKEHCITYIDWDGTLFTNKGKIGGWNITADGIHSGETYSNSLLGMSSNPSKLAFWVYSDANTPKFSVGHDGTLYAIQGTIGGWSINNKGISSSGNGHGSIYLSHANDSAVNWIRAYSGAGGGGDLKFSVSKAGKLYARDADIGGTITATGGTFKDCTIESSCKINGTLSASNITGALSTNVTIAGWKIGSGRFYSDDYGFIGLYTNSPSITVAGETKSDWRIVAGTGSDKNFGVDKSGNLYAKNANISGILKAGNGSTIGGWDILGGTLSATGTDKQKWTRLSTEGIEKFFSSPSETWNTIGWGYVYNVAWEYANIKSSDSDINIKNNISNIDNYNLLFDNLKPCRYKYNYSTSDRYHTGFIAQEVVSALEQSGLTTQDFAGVVHLKQPNENGSEWILRRDEFVALNTWQIQKLKSRVAELEQKIAALELKGEL